MRYAFHLLYSLPTVALAAEQASTSADRFDWDLVLKALGFVVAAVAAYFQARGLNLTSRASLKTDLEILKLLDSTDSNYQTIKTTVDDRIGRLYGPRPARSVAGTSMQWAITIVGLLWALGFSYWTFLLVRPGFTWWALLTGYQALMGAEFIFMGVTGTGFVRLLEHRQSAAGLRPPFARQ